jgi:hypothetical protein
VINEQAIVRDFFLEAAEKSGLTIMDWVVDPKTQKRVPMQLPQIVKLRFTKFKFTLNRKQTRQIGIAASYDGKHTLTLRFGRPHQFSIGQIRARHLVEKFDLTNPQSETQIIRWIQKKTKPPKIKARATPKERRMRRQRHRGIH